MNAPYQGSDEPTNQDRITALEFEVAELRCLLARCEREHLSLVTSYAALAAGREELVAQLEQDYVLLGQAVDARIAELAARLDGGVSRVATDVLRKIRLGMQELR